MNKKTINILKEKDIEKALQKGTNFLSSIQYEDGSWKGDYGGAIFLLPMYIGTCYITGEKIPAKEKNGFIKYYKNIRNSDGSIGLHPEDTGCMFTSVLSYAALRILGVSRDEKIMKELRGWILGNGTALGSASWGKFFLSLLNLYPYEGLNPILPELWHLPYALPFHPGKMWCHARQVYLPMAYLYGIKAAAAEDELIKEIRSDIYDTEYEKIDFTKHRNTVADCDNFKPYTRTLKAVNSISVGYEKIHSKRFRKKSLESVFEHILFEDTVTDFIDIGPVNSLYNTLVHFYRDTNGENYRKSFDRLKIYLWEESDGIKFNGYNSTALWDTAFAVQALYASPEFKKPDRTIDKAFTFIRNNQVLEDVPENKKYYRHASRGGWPFSDREHGWPITDCTAEGFKAASYIMYSKNMKNPIPDDLMKESIELILSFQNSDGGWSTYELRRGGYWLELLNPSSVFGDIMVDYPYVECTSSCIQALAKARGKFGPKLDRIIEKSISRGQKFLLKKQRPDGGFYGSWAVCFTYGTWFGIWGLLDSGMDTDSPALVKACRFLTDQQNSDGSWGESHLSSKENRWIRSDEGQVIQTAWVLMSLIRAGMVRSDTVRKGIQFLLNSQLENGDWPKQNLVGIFNKTTLLNYDNYRRYFPLWALGLYHKHIKDAV